MDFWGGGPGPRQGGPGPARDRERERERERERYHSPTTWADGGSKKATDECLDNPDDERWFPLSNP